MLEFRRIGMAADPYTLMADVAIVGAGPAGAATSLWLSKLGVRHVLFDAATFPRDKVCGDAQSGKAVSELRRLDPSLVAEMAGDGGRFLGSWGFIFVAPNGRPVEVPFRINPGGTEQPPGFLCRRREFDRFLVEHLDGRFVERHFGARVTGLERKPDGVRLTYSENGRDRQGLFQIVVGAGGDRCVVAKRFGLKTVEPRHYSAGLRAYYENVSGLHPRGFIELHFLPEVLPGYFWIFPLPNGLANVGIGVLSETVRKKRMNLKRILQDTVTARPSIAARFRNARLVAGPHGWGLPLGSKPRRISGGWVLLVGDAASLIDPLSGEGVGNALVSGRIAAEVIAEAVARGDFSGRFLQRYDQRIRQELGAELKLSHRLQRLMRRPWLFNLVANKASRDPELRETISHMFDDLNVRAKLRSPLFYLKLLLGAN